MSLTSKRALITGATSLIGQAIARRLSREGAQCVLVGRRKTELDEIAKSLPAPTPKKGEGEVHPADYHRVVIKDVTKDGPEGWLGIYQSAKSVDMLINGAGILHRELFFSQSPNNIKETLDTNLLGTMLGCNTYAKPMMRRKSGVIINIASLLATHGGKGAAAYAASKAGVIALTRSLAAEVGPFNVRVNAVLPGYIAAGMADPHMLAKQYGEDYVENLVTQIPLRRMGTPDEVADAVGFLVKNEYANNCLLNLDGGLSAV